MESRITSFDSFKTIAAFFVVLMHYPFQGMMGTYFCAIARIAVPFFFMVSGYFQNSQKKDAHRIKKSIKKLIWICMIVNVIYLLYRLGVTVRFNISHGYGITHGFQKIFFLLLSKRFLLINFSLAGHLWFVRALIYMLLFMVCMEHFKLEKMVRWAIPFVVLFELMLCKYSKFLFGACLPRIQYETFSKFAGTAFVYFMSGYFIRQEKFENSDRYQRLKLFFTRRNGLVFALIGSLVLGNIAELRLFFGTEYEIDGCNFLTTFFLAITIFLYLECNPSIGARSPLSFIGETCSMHIYLFHMLIARFLMFFLQKTEFYPCYYLIRPIFVYFVTLNVFALYYFIRYTLQYVKETKSVIRT